nr:MAG TPA: hypothetical protein [Caudoviricetes sp.]
MSNNFYNHIHFKIINSVGCLIVVLISIIDI